MKKEDYLKLIDDKYYEAKKKRISRMSVEWGKWSREMNVELRRKIESKKDPEELALKYVVIYWTIRSRMLELYFRSRFYGKNKIKKLSKEASDIKEITLTGKLKDISFEDAAKRVLG